MSKKETFQEKPIGDSQEDQDDPKKVDKHILKLARAVERVYGNPWSITWRNFLAGLVHAIGATMGYVLFMALSIFIAQKLGLFKPVSNFWKNLPMNRAIEQQEMPENFQNPTDKKIEQQQNLPGNGN